MQALRVPPRDPLERRQFQVREVGEGLAPPDEFGLVRAIDGLGHGVVVGVTDRAGRGQHAVLLDARGVDGADVLDPVVAVMDQALGAAMAGGPGDGLLQRLQRQRLRAHGRGARPSDDAAGERVGDESGVAERAAGHAHVGDVGDVKPVRSLRVELPVHEVGPAAGALGGPGGDGRFAAPHAFDSQSAHDAGHLVAAQFTRIPALRQQLRVDLPVAVHGHEEIRMDLQDVTCQGLVARGHAADRAGFEHAVAARREESAVQ